MTASTDVKVPPLSRHGLKPDPAEFERHALPYRQELTPAAVRLTRDAGDAEDLLQETFTRAFQKFAQFQPGTNLRAWLYRIMYSIFCSSGRRKAAGVTQTLAADVPDAAGSRAPTARSAEAQALENLCASPAMRALSELAEPYRTAIYLADVQGYRYGEIAELMGTPLGTVMSRIHRGRQTLRAQLCGQFPGRAATSPDGTLATVHRLADRRSAPVPASAAAMSAAGAPSHGAAAA